MAVTTAAREDFKPNEPSHGPHSTNYGLWGKVNTIFTQSKQLLFLRQQNTPNTLQQCPRGDTIPPAIASTSDTQSPISLQWLLKKTVVLSNFKLVGFTIIIYVLGRYDSLACNTIHTTHFRCTLSLLSPVYLMELMHFIFNQCSILNRPHNNSHFTCMNACYCPNQIMLASSLRTIFAQVSAYIAYWTVSIYKPLNTQPTVDEHPCRYWQKTAVTAAALLTCCLQHRQCNV